MTIGPTFGISVGGALRGVVHRHEIVIAVLDL